MEISITCNNSTNPIERGWEVNVNIRDIVKVDTYSSLIIQSVV